MSAKKTTNKAATKTPKAVAKKQQVVKPVRPKAAANPKKQSAIDAAARVLAESSEPMTTRAMIERMATQGYWNSPHGQTPSATLYSALAREIKMKGKNARFTKAGRGKFVAKA